jgi:hypothetical protein
VGSKVCGVGASDTVGKGEGSGVGGKLIVGCKVGGCVGL